MLPPTSYFLLPTSYYSPAREEHDEEAEHEAAEGDGGVVEAEAGPPVGLLEDVLHIYIYIYI